MPAAVPTTRRVRALLAERGLTIADMAAAIGRTDLTIRNVLTGSTVLAPTRQKITDFLGTEVFPGVKPRLEDIAFKLPNKTSITLPTMVGAELLQSLLHSSAKREGNRITLLEAVIVHIPTTPISTTAEKL